MENLSQQRKDSSALKKLSSLDKNTCSNPDFNLNRKQSSDGVSVCSDRVNQVQGSRLTNK